MLVIIAFVINPQLRTINNYLIINLAFADLVVGLVSMNFYTAYIGRKISKYEFQHLTLKLCVDGILVQFYVTRG